MDNLDLDFLEEHFGPSAVDADWRNEIYGLLDSFVQNHDFSTETTAQAVEKLEERLKSFSDGEFAFIVVQSGFIPDYYKDNGSEETLHTKLTEVIVAEWGNRLGFDTILQSEKSGKEDVTFRHDHMVVVCDAKSFRLGRSQAAPNAKDMIKQKDYVDWQKEYDDDAVGGLTTFPSTHDWKKKSRVYPYYTDKNSPIMLLSYQHMAYMQIQRIEGNNSFFEILTSYEDYFKGEPYEERDNYWIAINKAIQDICDDSIEINAFLEATEPIINEVVLYAKAGLEEMIQKAKDEIEERIQDLSYEDLQQQLAEALTGIETTEFAKKLANLISFRVPES